MAACRGEQERVGGSLQGRAGGQHARLPTRGILARGSYRTHHETSPAAHRLIPPVLLLKAGRPHASAGLHHYQPSCCCCCIVVSALQVLASLRSARRARKTRRECLAAAINVVTAAVAVAPVRPLCCCQQRQHCYDRQRVLRCASRTQEHHSIADGRRTTYRPCLAIDIA
eukprot:COSAG01_NODE_221_length_21422_cov_48.284294_15_plen_170_part_00